MISNNKSLTGALETLSTKRSWSSSLYCFKSLTTVNLWAVIWQYKSASSWMKNGVVTKITLYWRIKIRCYSNSCLPSAKLRSTQSFCSEIFFGSSGDSLLSDSSAGEKSYPYFRLGFMKKFMNQLEIRKFKRLDIIANEMEECLEVLFVECGEGKIPSWIWNQQKKVLQTSIWCINGHWWLQHLLQKTILLHLQGKNRWDVSCLAMRKQSFNDLRTSAHNSQSFITRWSRSFGNITLQSLSVLASKES